MKKVIAVIFSVMLVLSLTGCRTTVDTDNHDDLFGKFVVIETRYNASDGTLYTVYDKDTKVMYYYINSMYNHNLCPVYDTDGSVKVYSEELTK